MFDSGGYSAARRMGGARAARSLIAARLLQSNRSMPLAGEVLCRPAAMGFLTDMIRWRCRMGALFQVASIFAFRECHTVLALLSKAGAAPIPAAYSIGIDFTQTPPAKIACR
jgi:hypothetical protein